MKIERPKQPHEIEFEGLSAYAINSLFYNRILTKQQLASMLESTLICRLPRIGAKLESDIRKFMSIPKPIPTEQISKSIKYLEKHGYEVHKKEKAPQWTKEPPTVPGWYWVRSAKMEQRIVLLHEIGGKIMFEGMPASSRKLSWCGPLSPPV